MKSKGLKIFFGLLTIIFALSGDLLAQQQSVTYPCLGFPQYFGVPAGVTQITAEIVGGDAGDFDESGRGGKGAKLTTTINVTPGNVLTVYSGCKTGYGFTRGGKGGLFPTLDAWFWVGGAGGGSSAILNQNTVLAVAGGGGTAGYSSFFGVDGGRGGDAIIASGNGGNGNGSSPGTGGIFGGAPTGNGGNGTYGVNRIGGGGGGGYDPNSGGGAGGTGASGGSGGGGGGGKSYTNPSFVTASAQELFPGDAAENGFIRITYNGTSDGHRIERCTENIRTYTVPSQVRKLLVTGIGADGAGVSLKRKYEGRFTYPVKEDSPNRSSEEVNISGTGAAYRATINVVPGEQLLFAAGCEGKLSTIGEPLQNTNPGGAGGFGFISGGRGGDGDKPALLLNYGVGGVGGGGASGIGRNLSNFLFVAPGGGGGGNGGAVNFGCYGGEGGVGDGRNGGDASPCANKGIGGLTAGSSPTGGNACSFCTSGGGGGGGGGYPSGRGGTAGLIGSAGGGGGGGGGFYTAPGSQNIQTFDAEEYRRASFTLFPPPFGASYYGRGYFYETGEVFQAQDGVLTITPIYTDLAPPVIASSVSPLEPNGNNGWYRTNVSVSWQVTSDSPITAQTGCQSVTLTTDTTGFTSSCSATNSAGTTSGSAPTIKRDATLPNITASAVQQNGNPYTFGTLTSLPVTVTFSCSDATSGVAVCPQPVTFGSNATVSGTVVDNAGNSRTVNFGNIVSNNTPPTISPINNVETPVNVAASTAIFTVNDNETPAGNLFISISLSNQDSVSLGGIFVRTDANNQSNRYLEIVPNANKVGTTIITVTVTDASGAKASTSFTFSVKCGTITIQQLPGITYGEFLNNQLFPTGGAAPYRFEQTSGLLPETLQFDSEFIRIVGGPVRGSAPFTRNIGYTVTDSNGCSNPVTVTIDVACQIDPVVSQSNDDDVFSLRGWVEGACPNSTITFNQFFNNQELSIFGEISINKPLTIQGSGADKLTLKNVKPPGNNSNVLTVNSDATISGLTIKDGYAANAIGGGIRASANLTVRDSLITNNQAARGGGIAMTASDKTLTLINTTVSNNTSNSSFDGNGAGILSNGAVNIVNSTISGNTALGGNNSAAGIYAARGLISNSTIANNRVDNTFGAFNMASGIFGGSNNLLVRSSIIAGNQNNGAFPDVINLFTSNGFNLIGNRGTVTAFNQPTDQTGTSASLLNPLLAGLMMNGGTVPTHGFESFSSPAIDRGFAFGLTTDQRGMMRISDNPSVANAAGGDGSDIGAFEAQAAPTAATISISGRVLTLDGSGLMNARVTLTDQSGNARTILSKKAGAFRFDDVNVGEVYVITISSRRYTFAPQVISPTENLSDVNFTAQQTMILQ